MARVELNDVSKVYPGDVEAVREVSLAAEDGEFLVLVGPSGCGKSTTLRMIAGLEEVTSGKISIGENVVNTVAPKDRNIAMVFQNYALYPHMSVYQNMAFGLKLRKQDKKKIDTSVRDAAKVLDIEDILERKPKALSGGQRQRVALGRAIVRDPQVFLFDEPLSNLDAMLRVQMRGEIGRLHSRLKTTMIYVTHDQVEAMTMGDRIVVMKDGEVQQIDSPIQLYREPVNKFVAGFIGSPSMNFIDGAIERTNGVVTFQDSGRTISVSTDPGHRSRLEGVTGEQVVFGIRPEDISEVDGQEPGDVCVSAIVDVVEPLGSETLVHFKLGDAPFIAKLRSGTIPRVGETAKFNFAMERAHFFDSKTEAAIT